VTKGYQRLPDQAKEQTTHFRHAQGYASPRWLWKGSVPIVCCCWLARLPSLAVLGLSKCDASNQPPSRESAVASDNALANGDGGRRLHGAAALFDLLHHFLGRFVFGFGNRAGNPQARVYIYGRTAPEVALLWGFGSPPFWPLRPT
jgi:hypothetical protein